MIQISNMLKPILVLALAFLAFSCGKVTVELNQLPPNTPEGSSIYMAGNFNFWDPGDNNFRLERNEAGKYYIELPVGFGQVEYKFTRGDWTATEADRCGNSIPNRSYTMGLWHSFFGKDTIRNQIWSWSDQGPTDCDRATFRLKRLPKETPKDAKVYMVGSFNDWQPDDARFIFRQSSKDGYLYVTIPGSEREIEYKITRGGWDKEALDMYGNRVINQKFRFGERDTVDISVEGWLDINPGLQARKVTFVVATPLGTPPEDPLFIVGSFNKWKPGDPNYQMKKVSQNLFTISIEKPEGEMEYKFTRGPWGKEEVDIFGNHISNRQLRTSSDTVWISIPEWLDIPTNQTFTLDRKNLEFLLNNPNVIAFPLTEEEHPVRFTLTNTLKKPTFLYTRLALPASPQNRNYGITELVKPGQEINILTPEGTVFYACDGPYWHDFKPKEVKIFKVDRSMEGKIINGDPLFLNK